MSYDEKLVTWRSVEKGMEVCGTEGSGGASYFHGVVESINASRIVILLWGREPKEFDSEDTMFRIKMSREEFEKKIRSSGSRYFESIKNQRSSICHWKS